MSTQTIFSKIFPRVDLLDITRERTEVDLAVLMHVAGNSARAVTAANKVRVANRITQAIVELKARLKARI